MKPSKSSREWDFRIHDILKSIDKVDKYIDGMTLAQFKKNELVIDAVIRNFEIIGEASKNVPIAIQQSYSDLPWKQMNGMRNTLIHEYFGVDLDTIWYTAKKELPSLKKLLIDLLANKNS